MDEATRAIQTIVAALPSYHLSDAEVSPRVRATFRDVRQAMLPAIIEQKYAEAKASGVNLPSNHSALFAPDADPALRTGVAAEVAVLRNLLN